MRLKIKELPISERPYEKLEMYGASGLSNSELLAIIIKTGTKEETSLDLAQKIIALGKAKENQDLTFLQDLSIEELMTIKGIGKVKALQLKAVGELTKRMARPANSFKILITHPQDVANLLMQELKNEKREILKLLILNSKNFLLKVLDVSAGGTNHISLEPKHILYEPIKMQAANIILVHNHPSGDPNPSQADILMTERIDEVADIMGIRLLDHIIIGNGMFKSILKNHNYVSSVLRKE